MRAMWKWLRVAFALLAVLALAYSCRDTFGIAGLFGPEPREVTYSQFVSAVESESVRSVKWQGGVATATSIDGTEFRTRVPSIDSSAGASLHSLLQQHTVEVELEPPPGSAVLLPMVGFIVLPILFFTAFYYIFIKPATLAAQTAMDERETVSRKSALVTLRLKSLESMLEHGNITQSEYDEQRKRILDDL